ncbi:FHA domain-containing protein [Clostridium sp. UBA4548]|uniref:FHA domain-containing protein n=1 Tax=Clostridium sp. UBA4548 TaxID=1946361 RepID=UPI0025C027A4|nr:FHA domain-containing protein [Clostridium sp. UBA4548]
MNSFKFIFNLVIIAIIYFIIIYALKIMYNDTKSVGKKKKKKTVDFGLEVVDKGDNHNLRSGGVIPVNEVLTMGRNEDNMVVLEDRYVSSHHLKIYFRNTDYILEDLNSTNGTFVNEVRIKNKVTLNKGDKIRVGTSTFKVL